MPALSPLDLAMFLLESPERPFNIGPLVLLRPPADFKGSFADKLLARMLQRPAGAPFDYRLQMSLLRAPSVESIGAADLRPHVHRLTLRRASTAQLLKKVCELHESVLERSGMLWQFWVIDGLADGRVALYAKVHHGIIDGRGFVGAMMQWLSEDPQDKQVRALWEALPRSAAGGARGGGLLQSLLRGPAQAAGWLKSAAGVYGLLAEQGLRASGLGKGTALPFLQVPKAFHGKLSAQRSCAYCSLPLDELKALGKAQRATVNDLLLTLVDMAMQRHLAQDGKTPAQPLVADMPIALSAGAKGGNQIAVLQFPLGRADATPAQRLAAVRAETARLKQSLSRRSSDTVMLYTTLVHALPLLAEKAGVKRAPRLANLLVSNPFGLDSPRWLMGAAVELMLPISLVSAGHQLNITAVTLGPRLQIGFLAMPDAVPQIERLAQYTEQAFPELARSLEPAPVPPAPKRAASKRRRRPSPVQPSHA
ncbi:MAG TPA: wax ester/triacylglycerol synthase family O-acyltransferase [Rubrivivax sp.]|nr:wax ester/triacylglycerol synthase family O-acyltransferase [Rubrivivax sp.]